MLSVSPNLYGNNRFAKTMIRSQVPAVFGMVYHSVTSSSVSCVIAYLERLVKSFYQHIHIVAYTPMETSSLLIEIARHVNGP
jgi:hypothetical protein